MERPIQNSFSKSIEYICRKENSISYVLTPDKTQSSVPPTKVRPTIGPKIN